jgi:hypothetical protein
MQKLLGQNSKRKTLVENRQQELKKSLQEMEGGKERYDLCTIFI